MTRDIYVIGSAAAVDRIASCCFGDDCIRAVARRDRLRPRPRRGHRDRNPLPDETRRLPCKLLTVFAVEPESVSVLPALSAAAFTVSVPVEVGNRNIARAGGHGLRCRAGGGHGDRTAVAGRNEIALEVGYGRWAGTHQRQGYCQQPAPRR